MIYALLPEVTKTHRFRKSRLRSYRAPLSPVVGTILRSLFGTSTTEDTDMLKTHMMEIADTQNKEITIMKKQTAALSSFVEQSTERMDKLTAAVKLGPLDNLHLMQTASKNLYRTSDYQTALLSYAITLENAIQLVQTKYAELLMAIETLINGHLSPFLVPAETLNATLYDIQAHLRSRGRYSLIYTTPGWYFHRSSFVYAREKETLFITLQIPLTTFQTGFTVYEIKQYPLALPNSDQNTMRLKDLPSGFAIDDSREFYYTLTKQELDDIGVHHHAYPRTIYTKTRPWSCLTAIFQDEKSEVDRLCMYEIITNTLKPTISLVKDNKYLLTKVDNYTLLCPDGSRVKEGCQQCLISPPPKWFHLRQNANSYMTCGWLLRLSQNSSTQKASSEHI